MLTYADVCGLQAAVRATLDRLEYREHPLSKPGRTSVERVIVLGDRQASQKKILKIKIKIKIKRKEAPKPGRTSVERVIVLGDRQAYKKKY
jgi:hypothetical protein